MAEAAESPARPGPKGKLGLIIGLVLGIVLGGVAFYAVVTGLVFGAGGHEVAADSEQALPDIAFVPIDPVIVSLGPVERKQHLRFRSQLEVTSSAVAEVTLLLPRILDVLNGYLRAVEVSELEDPTALVRVRAQLLRRIQMVTGEGRVRDLLISEFVLN